mmetsp:Transcript_828/g.5154  ORF Transcript_828/g.5154 Transcript_828/m.5154 type:complete len:105 (+) Transcript_828:4941-5255(+)
MTILAQVNETQTQPRREIQRIFYLTTLSKPARCNSTKPCAAQARGKRVPDQKQQLMCILPSFWFNEKNICFHFRRSTSAAEIPTLPKVDQRIRHGKTQSHQHAQ